MATNNTTVKKMSQGYGYKYSDLATIHEELEKQSITYHQFVKFDIDAGADYMWTVLKRGDKTEEPICGCRIVQAELGGKSNPAQENGSALTYARRYSLLMALGWATDDDDAEKMNGVKARAPKPKGELDFKEVREKIRSADSSDEVRRIYAEIPPKLQQYFEDDCRRIASRLESETINVRTENE